MSELRLDASCYGSLYNQNHLSPLSLTPGLKTFATPRGYDCLMLENYPAWNTITLGSHNVTLGHNLVTKRGVGANNP